MSYADHSVMPLLRRPLIRRGLVFLGWVMLGALVLLNSALLVRHVILSAEWAGPPFDWSTFETAVNRISSGTLYDWEFRGSYEYSYRYTPLFAYAIAPFVQMGLVAWRLLHFAALLLLPWKVALLVALSWPFWEDVLNANVMTFALVSGWLALHGNRWGGAAYLALTILVPRPLMLPLAAWLVWKRPRWRLPAAAMVAVAAALTLATGEAMEFLAALSRTDDMLTFPRNFGPTRWFGLGWLAVGIPLGLLLLWRNHVGWAGLAVSPYVLPYHFLLAFLELRAPPDGTGQTQARDMPG